MREPKIIDAEFTVIEPKDTRPIWQRYKLVMDPWVMLGAGLLAAASAARHLVGG